MLNNSVTVNRKHLYKCKCFQNKNEVEWEGMRKKDLLTQVVHNIFKFVFCSTRDKTERWRSSHCIACWSSSVSITLMISRDMRVRSEGVSSLQYTPGITPHCELVAAGAVVYLWFCRSNLQTLVILIIYMLHIGVCFNVSVIARDTSMFSKHL